MYNLTYNSRKRTKIKEYVPIQKSSIKISGIPNDKCIKDELELACNRVIVMT